MDTEVMDVNDEHGDVVDLGAIDPLLWAYINSWCEFSFVRDVSHHRSHVVIGSKLDWCR